jgi:transposase
MSTDATNPAEHPNDAERLFADGPAVKPTAAAVNGPPRLKRPDRTQMRMQMQSLEAMLADDHQARVVWDYVEGLDLSELHGSIRSVAGRAGRDAIDPRMLMALWLYATLEAVGSARQLDDLCRNHVAYQWICGGVSVNYHTLSDFRTANVERLDRMLTESVTVLMHQELVTLKRVAQDGVRVRASAGTSSFRREPTLERLAEEARQQVEALRQEVHDDPAGSSKRQQAARERARRERQQRIQRAREELPDVRDKKPADKKDQARASTSDSEARFMKMPDGGVRPAFNVQFATDTASQIITGVEVSNNGSDMGQMEPMRQQHGDRYGKPPEELLADGGFAARQDIDSASRAEPPTTVYAPVQRSRKRPGQECYERQPADTDAVAQWRQRMSTPEAQLIYRDRASTAECVNAIARNRGLRQFLVRGLRKVKAVALWYALAHNVIRAAFLVRQAQRAVG